MSVSARLIVFSCMAAALLPAQDTRARVQGTVTDSTSAVVVQATVTLINTETGVRATQASNSAGAYLFDLVLPGTYTVSVETPYGYVPTVTGRGTTGTDSNPSPANTTPPTLAAAASDLTIDFGFYRPVTVGDFVW